jgi:nicotinamidase-related amidase
MIFTLRAATDFCIDATVKAALSKDYNVTVVSDAHTTDDKPDLPASILIKHYNWIWSVMAPTKQRISVGKAEMIDI